MSTVLLFTSMSIDGYVTGPNISLDDPLGQGGERLHEWMFAEPMADGDAELLTRTRARITGSVVGRRTFDVGLPHWKDVPWPGPSFVVTHKEKEPLAQPSGTFTFVAGVPEAVAAAREAVGDGTVVLMGTDVCRQSLAAGLVDEVLLSLVPITLGGGNRLFDGIDGFTLRPTGAVASPAVTHLSYDVVR